MEENFNIFDGSGMDESNIEECPVCGDPLIVRIETDDNGNEIEVKECGMCCRGETIE